MQKRYRAAEVLAENGMTLQISCNLLLGTGTQQQQQL